MTHIVSIEQYDYSIVHNVTLSYCYYVHIQDVQYHSQFGATRTIEVVVHVHFVNVTLTSSLYEICD